MSRDERKGGILLQIYRVTDHYLPFVVMLGCYLTSCTVCSRTASFNFAQVAFLALERDASHLLSLLDA
jgi:hypothetical protein